MVSAIWNIRQTTFLALAISALALACDGPPPPTPTATASTTTDPSATAMPTLAPSPTPTPTPSSTGRTSATVVRVVDGDTINVTIGGQAATIRYIGVDTPETVAPGQPVGCYGREASNWNKALLEGKTVDLEKDVSETDRFGRLLRYVYLDGQMVNETLVSEGYAKVSTFPPDVKHVDRFLAAQQEARVANRGLWGACTTPQPESSPVNGNCDPAYPTVCIPSPPPDLDCPDIPYRRFQVLPPDPHRFDGSDNDGIGCGSE